MQEDWESKYIALAQEYSEFKGISLNHSIETSKELEDALEEQSNDLAISLESHKQRNEELQLEVEKLKQKYNAEVRAVENENYKLKDTIDRLNKVIKEKDGRVMKLEVENTELESRVRVLENSLATSRDKLSAALEKYALMESEHEELKENYRADTERLRQEAKDLQDEIEADIKKLALKNTPGNHVGRAFSNASTVTVEADVSGVNECDLPKGLNAQSFTSIECLPSKANELPIKIAKDFKTTNNLLKNISAVTENTGHVTDTMINNIEAEPKTLLLIDRLLDNINANLTQISIIN